MWPDEAYVGEDAELICATTRERESLRLSLEALKVSVYCVGAFRKHHVHYIYAQTQEIKNEKFNISLVEIVSH